MDNVYIFDFGDKIKVGYTTDVKKRLRAIELSSGIKSKRIYSVHAGRKEEKFLHSLLNNRLEGEFFAFPFSEAKNLLDNIIRGEIKVPDRKGPTEAQKRASNKYNLKNMATLGCKVKKEEAKAFKDYCSQHGKTSNTVLKEYVYECIGKDDNQMEQDEEN